jgi:hypothetical protein
MGWEGGQTATYLINLQLTRQRFQHLDLDHVGGDLYCQVGKKNTSRLACTISKRYIMSVVSTIAHLTRTAGCNLAICIYTCQDSGSGSIRSGLIENDGNGMQPDFESLVTRTIYLFALRCILCVHRFGGR